jgi:hypothetical protein
MLIGNIFGNFEELLFYCRVTSYLAELKAKCIFPSSLYYHWQEVHMHSFSNLQKTYSCSSFEDPLKIL